MTKAEQIEMLKKDCETLRQALHIARTSIKAYKKDLKELRTSYRELLTERTTDGQ